MYLKVPLIFHGPLDMGPPHPLDSLKSGISSLYYVQNCTRGCNPISSGYYFNLYIIKQKHSLLGFTDC